jgi:diacylglycerol kinase family enzyme
MFEAVAAATPPPAATPPVDGPLFIVFNASSGHEDAQERRELIRAHLSLAGREFELLIARPGQTLGALAREAVVRAQAARGVVVAAGGDGTINAVAQQVLGSGCAFGVLPQGTFNYFSRAHGIQADSAAAIEVLLAGHCRPVQVGLVNERIFLVNASLGLYPQLLEDREAYKARFGRSRLVAILAGIRSLLQAHRQLRLRVAWWSAGADAAVSEISLRTPTLFICNNRLQLDQIGIPEAAALEHGQLVAIALRPVGSLAMTGLLLRGALGQLGEADQVLSGAFRQMTVHPGRRLARRRRLWSPGRRPQPTKAGASPSRVCITWHLSALRWVSAAASAVGAM